MFDVLAYIGRFQPFHKGHKSVVDFALARAERVVIVVGSAGSARTAKNPWTEKERIAMIRACFTPEEAARLVFLPQRDYPYNFDKWLASVTAGVQSIALSKFKADPYRIGLIGLDKDHSSFYLHHFPQWESVEYRVDELIHASDIRECYFGLSDAAPDKYDSLLPPEVIDWLTQFQTCDAKSFHEVSEEGEFVKLYKTQWAKAPYAPTFVTVDAVVTQAAHVLMVSRKDMPGRGLLALPGGFLEQHETLKDGAIRELREETNIRLPVAVLRGAIVNHKTFDAPDRSLRGRTITTAFHFKLDEKELPKVKGGDDATRARWIPIADLKRDQCFEDHFDIIETLVL